MKELEDRIVSEGEVLDGDVLKVGGFLNQRIDTALSTRMGTVLAEKFRKDSVTLVLTVESSGIALAFAVASALGVPLLFAKKNLTSNLDSDVYSAKIYSFTHGRDYNCVVSKKFISEADKVLIVDDFLANGCALRGLINLVGQAGAKLVGCGVAIEKGFQNGGDSLRNEKIRVESLAIVSEMSEGHISFR